MGMNELRIININTLPQNKFKPRLDLRGQWLGNIGFTHGTLVRFLPEPGGVLFTLCDENIPRYSTLYNDTHQRGGTLLQTASRNGGPFLGTSGIFVVRAGLEAGDAIIVRHEHGFIHGRKLPHPSAKIVVNPVAGTWLADVGFDKAAVFTMASAPGLLTCTLQENALERTAELVKYARANKLTLLQVSQANHKLRFFIPPLCMERAGFTPGDQLIATYRHGLIQLQKPDFIGLGF